MKGKKVLITGAGQGIGLASVKAFLEVGAEVIATDINTQQLEDLPGARAYYLDVTSESDIESLKENIGSVDVIFNCAGYVHAGNIMECDLDAWNKSFDLNVTSMYQVIKAFIPGMLERGQGSIINMASVASSIKGVPNRLAYTASKAAVIGLTKAVAADYIKNGIRCNAICPGTVDSPSLRDRIADQAIQQNTSEDIVFQQFIDRQPMGRIGTAEEIAKLAVYLGSDDSSYTTGTVQIIDGGMSI